MIILAVGGLTAFVLYKAFNVRGRVKVWVDKPIQMAVDEALWQESITRAQETLAKHEAALEAVESTEELADRLREELEELEFRAQEEWWQNMESTLADIRNLPEGLSSWS